MKISKKAIILTGIVVFCGALMSFASAKSKQMKVILENLKIKVLPKFKSAKIEDSALKFKLDVGLENPTSEHFTLSSGGMIAVTGFRLIKDGKSISAGSLGNLSNIEIPQYGTGWIKDIQVEIPLLSLSEVVKDILTNGGGWFSLLENLFTKDGLKKLVDAAKTINWSEQLKSFAFEVDIEGFGQTHTHRQKFV